MSDKSGLQRREIHYSGHVQGVGFRFTTHGVAARFDVSGWVKNLPDGRVKVIVEGTAAELDQFQRAVDDAMAGHIDHTNVETGPARGDLEGFEIQH